jgi:glycosyltransferase involved in cell wall biosynthesis
MEGPHQAPRPLKPELPRVCYILSYYCPDYVRTRVLLKALEKSNRTQLYLAVNHSRNILRYFQTLMKLIFVRVVHKPELYILGFRGYEIFWPVRAITSGKALVLDHMMSPYDSLRYEKEKITRGSLADKLLYRYEKAVLEHSDIILTDTCLHSSHFSKMFGVGTDRIHAIPVGTDEELFSRSSTRNETQVETRFFHVLFYGSFLPLHGVDVILKAASLLRKIPIRFTLIGGKHKNLPSFHAMMDSLQLDNIVHRDWVDFNALPDLVSQADLCLGGPFGGTGQAQRVITGKTFQFLAMAKPTVVGRIDADFGFVDRENCLVVPQRDPEALANAILWSLHHRQQLFQIGEEGWALYQRRYSVNCILGRLESVLGL